MGEWAVLGLDIGGANLKAAHSDGATATWPFALWRAPESLGDVLHRLIAGLPRWQRLAVTMTGELCDCFPGKRAGVEAILAAVEGLGDSVVVWNNEGRFLSLAGARAAPDTVASANWLALATFAGRFVPKGAALLVDVGTTTTDVVPLVDGVPAPRGRIDPVRLMAGELLYRGWRRTPLMALADERTAAELFATAHDVYLTLGLVPEAPEDRDTADGQPATAEYAGRRIARMWCAEPHEIDLVAAACYFGARLEEQVGNAIADVMETLPAWPRGVVLSGSGTALARGGLERAGLAQDVAIVSLAERLGPGAAEAACAVAVATLASERGP